VTVYQTSWFQGLNPTIFGHLLRKAVQSAKCKTQRAFHQCQHTSGGPLVFGGLSLVEPGSSNLSQHLTLQDQGTGHGVIFRVGSRVGFDLISQDDVGAGVAGVGGSQVLTEFSDGGGGPLRW
jgi:hypothetical protein